MLGGWATLSSAKFFMNRCCTGKVSRNMRILGNIGLVFGQIFLLFVSRKIGLSIMVVCGLMGLPYFLSRRYYDVVAIIAVSLLINLVGLFVGP
jgi:hypothetical protein